MQVSVETVEGLERRMTVAVPAEKIDGEIKERIKKLQQTVNLKGFRPGKVPTRVLQQRYGDAVRYEVLESVMRESFQEALKEQDITPAGSPSIEPKQVMPGEPLEYTAVFEVFPEIELTELNDVEITKKEAEINDSDIELAINRLREQHADWNDVERAAADGDKIILDFIGSVDGEEFEGGKATEFELLLGSKSMIPGFEDGIIGMKANDEKDINVTFPAEYPHKDLAGKEAVFAIKAHRVQSSTLPEVDDQFAEKAGIKEGGVEKLKSEIKTSLAQEVNNHLQAHLKTQVVDKLIELNPLNVPKGLVKNEINTMKDMAVAQSRQQIKKESLPDAMYEKEAEKRVHLGLLMREAIKRFELEVDKDKVRQRIEDMTAAYEQREEIIKYYYSNQNLMNEVNSAVLEQQVIDKLLEAANVKVETTSYTEIMDEEEQAS